MKVICQKTRRFIIACRGFIGLPLLPISVRDAVSTGTPAGDPAAGTTRAYPFRHRCHEAMNKIIRRYVASVVPCALTGVALLVAAAGAHAHGRLTEPPSRIVLCTQGQNPNCHVDAWHANAMENGKFFPRRKAACPIRSRRPTRRMPHRRRTAKSPAPAPWPAARAERAVAEPLAEDPAAAGRVAEFQMGIQRRAQDPSLELLHYTRRLEPVGKADARAVQLRRSARSRIPASLTGTRTRTWCRSSRPFTNAGCRCVAVTTSSWRSGKSRIRRWRSIRSSTRHSPTAIRLAARSDTAAT